MNETRESLSTKSESSSARLSLVQFFAKNSVAANLLMVALLVGGFLVASGLSSQVFPQIDPRMITVSVPYPGATPSEVEESITRRVDTSVRGIDGIDRVVSKASEGYGRITIELVDFADKEKARDSVQSAVDQLTDFPPADAEEPEVVAMDALQNVMVIALVSNADEMYLNQAVRELEQELLEIPIVSHVSVEGNRDFEIAIEVSEEMLRQYQLTIDNIANAIQQSSLNLSSGELRTEAGDLLLRTEQKRETGEEFRDIVLRTLPGGAVLRLGDIANIEDGFADTNLTNEVDGERAVFIRIQAAETENVLDVAEAIKEFLANRDSQPGIDVRIWEDSSENLKSRINLLVRNGTLGFALVFFFLVVMLDLRLAFWVAMGIPISFLGGFLFFDAFGVTINMVSLFALIIVLGIVVDDAIVVGENIGNEQQKGLQGSAASIAGVKGVFAPVFIGVLTTIVAFIPLTFTSGQMGQILGVIPVVVITVLTISLVEVFLILPAHLSHSERWSRWPLDRIQTFIAERIEWFRDNWFVLSVRHAVRHRYLTVVYALAMLVLAVVFISNGAVRVEFFPSVESDQISISLSFPLGTPFAVTEAAAYRIRDAVNAVNADLGGTAVKAVGITAGSQEVGQSRGPPTGEPVTTESGHHLASVTIQLQEEPIRTSSAVELETLIRRRIGTIPGVESLTIASDLIAESSTLEYELSHANNDQLSLATTAMRERLAEMPMLTEIRDTLSDGKRQFDIQLTPEGEAVGLSQSVVARQLRQNFFGQEVQRIQRGSDEVKIMVRYPGSDRKSTSDLFNTRIRLQDGTEVPLSAVATVEETRSYSAIDRIDGVRVVTISAEVDKTFMSTGEATNRVEQEVVPTVLAQFPGLTINQAGFGRDQARDLGSLGTLALVAIIVIFALIAALMRSYTMPFIVLSGIPFGAAGAVIGHYLLGYDVSMVSMFGMVALSGVVVNDSLVLMDRFKRLREEKPDLTIMDAVVEATRLRFRAIFLTTATTALGLTPMLFESSLQAKFLIPLAVSLAIGILFASFVIVFLVPSLVMIRDDFFRIFRRLRTMVSAN